MSYKTSFRRRSSFDETEQPAEQTELQEQLEEVDPELLKYEARRKITRMVIIRIVMCLMLLATAILCNIPFAMRIVLVVVILLILGTMIPVLTTLKTTLKYEDE